MHKEQLLMLCQIPEESLRNGLTCSMTLRRLLGTELALKSHSTRMSNSSVVRNIVASMKTVDHHFVLFPSGRQLTVQIFVLRTTNEHCCRYKIFPKQCFLRSSVCSERERAALVDQG